jgi:hypothetical protein
VHGVLATSDYFEVFGTRPRLTDVQPTADAAAGELLVVLSHYRLVEQFSSIRRSSVGVRIDGSP